MPLDPLTAILDIGKVAIDKIWPDPLQRAAQLHQLEQLHQTGDLALLDAHVQLMLGQIEVNKEAAKHPSLFVSGARPAAIWSGVFAMTWAGVLHPLLTWAWAFMEMTGTPPPLIESSALTVIVTGLLGVSGMRTVDGIKGTKTQSLGEK